MAVAAPLASRHPGGPPMSNNYRDRMTVTPLNPPDVPIERKLRELAGDRPPEDQAAYIEIGDVDTLAALSPTAIDEGDPPDEAARRELLAEIGEGEPPAGDEDVFLAHAERLDLLSELELRAEET